MANVLNPRFENLAHTQRNEPMGAQKEGVQVVIPVVEATHSEGLRKEQKNIFVRESTVRYGL